MDSSIMFILILIIILNIGILGSIFYLKSNITKQLAVMTETLESIDTTTLISAQVLYAIPNSPAKA